MYNPIVVVEFRHKGLKPFYVETTFEEVFIDNPTLKPDIGMIAQELMEHGVFAKWNGALRMTVKE